MDDFASGTSSRSTKLIHGGVRYLQKAILNLDWEQYKMVKEALHERSSMLKTAPHLTHAIPIMLPVYEYVLHMFNIIEIVSFYRISCVFFFVLGGGKFLTTGLVSKLMIL